MQTLPLKHIFVYGTLRQGELNDINSLLPAPDWIGLGSVQGLLYNLGAYPGLRLNVEGGCMVKGEVYAIGADLEQRLDQIEEVWPQQTGEYAKREIEVQLTRSSVLDPSQTNEKLICLVYEISTDRIVGKPIITNGDWVLYRHSRSR